MKELSIIPECYVDTKVAEIVGQAVRKYNHQHGCGSVANQLKNKFKGRIGLGIIDEDKGKGPTAKYFTEFEEIGREHSLILKKHKEERHFLILICPEIEKWLLKDAEIAKIDPEKFELPKGLVGLKQITKTQNIDKNIEFYRFIKQLINKKAPSITVLKRWLWLFNEDALDTLK